jgi:hypothetical protein
MKQAEETRRYVVCASSHARRDSWVVDVVGSRQEADYLLHHLFACPPCRRNLVTADVDYIVIWHGIHFYRARLLNGHELTERTFDYYLQEMTA